MQFYFPPEVNRSEIPEILRFWVLEYHVDGFHLMGERLPMEAIVSDELLADRKLLYYGFEDAAPREARDYQADETVIPPVKLKPTHIRSIVEVTAESVGLREEFILATPIHMIEVEYDPAEMLCGISEVPVINAGHTRLSTSGGFTDKISQIVRILK